MRALLTEGGLPRVPKRALLVLGLVVAAVVGLNGVRRSFRDVPAGSAGIALNRLSGGAHLVRPGTHFLPRWMYGLSLVRVSDQLVAGREASLEVSSKEGLAVGLAFQARWAVDDRQLLAHWSSLPEDPGREVVAPIVASAFRSVAPAYEATAIRAEKREELTTAAAKRAQGRLAEAGILLKDVAVADVRLPAEYERARLALLEEQQSAEKKTATLKIKEKEIEETRLTAEAEKVKREKASETEAAQKLIAAKAESDAMEYILPLKEKAIRQQELESEADKARKIKDAQAEAEAGNVKTEAEARRRRTLADAEAYAIRATSAAQFENLKREAELIQANPTWVSKTFAEKLSDKVQVILAPNLANDPFTGEMMRHLANGQPALPARKTVETAGGAAEDPPESR
jgi:regulator of protease activity HflC (stomatin/prohibitin superfamily)